MSKYTSDDNRSMQLNDNNDRYYSSRGIDRYDDDYSDEEYDPITGQKKPPEFQGYIPLEDWIPFFKTWIQNLKINSNLGDTFIGFNYWNDSHREQWFYYRTRALIDYCTDKGKKWSVMENGFLWEYRVQDWRNFAFYGNNIVAVNRIIYENNDLEFPSNAEELFLINRTIRIPQSV